MVTSSMVLRFYSHTKGLGDLGGVTKEIAESFELGDCCSNLEDVSLVDRIVSHLREDQPVNHLWAYFLNFMAKLGKELGIARQSLAMELCIDTLDADKVIRVHTHVFCEFSSQIQIRSGGRFLFRLGAPHVSV